MDYCTLDEAAAVLNRRPGSPSITAAQLLRGGAAGRLLICVPLDVNAYSPTVRVRNEGSPATHSPDDRDGDIDRATVEMYGLFVVPPRILFALESNESTKLFSAHSLDGKDIFFPNVVVRRDQLRITAQHLQALASMQPPAAVASALNEPRQTSRAQEEAILKAICDLGLNATNLPNPGRGRAAARSQVLNKLCIPSRVFVSKKAFELAWDRALESKVIAIAPASN